MISFSMSRVSVNSFFFFTLMCGESIVIVSFCQTGSRHPSHAHPLITVLPSPSAHFAHVAFYSVPSMFAASLPFCTEGPTRSPGLNQSGFKRLSCFFPRSPELVSTVPPPAFLPPAHFFKVCPLRFGPQFFPRTWGLHPVPSAGTKGRQTADPPVFSHNPPPNTAFPSRIALSLTLFFQESY